MPAERLFWADPYLASCAARVTRADGAAVTLDRTVAFAFSGGQASDRATIAGLEVLSATIEGDDIVYELAPGHGLGPGDEVEVRIDWPTRYRIMRLHFAAELVLELVNRLYGRPEKTGANITAEKARVDFVWDGTIARAFPVLEAELARVVAADLPITSAFSDETRLRRTWEVEGFARVECGGTHLRRTGEVGAVRLRRENPGSGRERIVITLVDG